MNPPYARVAHLVSAVALGCAVVMILYRLVH